MQVEDFLQTRSLSNNIENFKEYLKTKKYFYNTIPSIHIGGTNGKGSTICYLSNILQESNYCVGTFTTPSLTKRCDIIQINGIPIEQQLYDQYINHYKNEFEQWNLSIFEIEVFIAFLYFYNQKVDLMILEVGLGGSYDATNVVVPLVSVITNIGKDHCQYLGNTYSKIAASKAGIIKPNIGLLTGETKEECLRIFKQQCARNTTNLFQVQPIKVLENQRFQYKDYTIELNALGKYQMYNSALAIEIIDYLNTYHNYTISYDAIYEGCKHALWQGRFEKVWDQPEIIIDGAHNLEGIQAFVQSAKQYSNRKIIFSFLNDKESQDMLKCLLDISNDLTYCYFDDQRVLPTSWIEPSSQVRTSQNYKEAIKEALQHDGTVFITGSLHFVAVVRTYILKLKEESTV